MFNLFKKKKVAELEFDFSSIGTDMHSHIIPGIDDGAKTIDDSITLAKQFKHLGFKKIVATPHIMADFYRNTPDTIQKGLDILREALLKNNIDLEVDAAAEYYLDETFDNKLKRKEILSFGDNCLLFELSYVNPPQNILDILFKIQDAGFHPVLAHPERYPFYHGSIENYQQLKEQGCFLQLNTISLTGYYGKECKKAAEEMVDNYCVDFIGSDMHHINHAFALRDSLYTKRVQALLGQHQLNNILL